MPATDAPVRNQLAAEYLRLLQSLAGELERAMHAIARNGLSELEESVSNQQALSTRLGMLVNGLCAPLESDPSGQEDVVGTELAGQIRGANHTLHTLNKRYAALLRHSSHSVDMMVSLCKSFTGNIQEGSGAGSKHQTWSCRM